MNCPKCSAPVMIVYTVSGGRAYLTYKCLVCKWISGQAGSPKV